LTLALHKSLQLKRAELNEEEAMINASIKTEISGENSESPEITKEVNPMSLPTMTMQHEKPPDGGSPGLQARIRELFEKEAGISVPDWDYDAIERIRDMFQDEASKQQYEQEVIYLALRELGIDNAVRYSPCGNKQWKNAASLAITLQDGFQFQRLNGWRMPKLDIPAGSDDLELYFHLTTFIFERYRYGDEVRINDGDVVLDCGARVGDTAVWSLSYGASSVHCFEPDTLNLAALNNNAARYGGGKITIVPSAVGKGAGTMQFIRKDNSCGESGITENIDSGALTVPVICIDDYVREHGIEPSFIKMDLEGSEIDALTGAKETLAKYKPKLAISLYHKPSDMWTIPDVIRSIVPEYRYWCRKNNPVYEFVLYGAV
jgi:FkbM family methyltransferase